MNNTLCGLKTLPLVCCNVPALLSLELMGKTAPGQDTLHSLMDLLKGSFTELALKQPSEVCTQVLAFLLTLVCDLDV